MTFEMTLARSAVIAACLHLGQDSSTWTSPSGLRVAISSPWRIVENASVASALRRARIEDLKPALGGKPRPVQKQSLAVERLARIAATCDAVLLLQDQASSQDQEATAASFARLVESPGRMLGEVDFAPTERAVELRHGERVLTVALHGPAAKGPAADRLVEAMARSLPNSHSAAVVPSRTGVPSRPGKRSIPRPTAPRRAIWLALLPFTMVAVLLLYAKKYS